MTEKLPADLIRQHKGISFTGVATTFLCHDGQGNIFFAKRSQRARDEQGRWDIGGGGLKWGVTAIDNVKREIEEEYSATPLSIEFLGYRDVFRTLNDGTPTHWVGLDYLVRLDREAVKINEPDMFDDSGWFSLDNLPSPLHSQFPSLLDKYRTIIEQTLRSR